MAKLVVLNAGLVGKSFELKADRTTLGRLEDNGFQISEPSVSSHHCEVELRADGLAIKDLDSTNGSFINGNAIKEAVLRPGQTLRLGQVELRLEDVAGMPTPPPPPARKDHTAPPPAGVRLNELDQGAKAAGSPFAKKSNKVNKGFLIAGIVMGVIIVLALVYAIMQTESIAP